MQNCSTGYILFKNTISMALIVILALGTFAVWHSVLAANSSSITSKVTVPNSTPTVTSVTLNANNSLTLTANATTTFSVAYTITDANGCGDIMVITSTIFRITSSTQCEVESPTTNNLDCYVAYSNSTSSCISSTQLNGTSTFLVYYFANATDASSSYSGQSWLAYVVAKDGSGATSTTTNATSSFDTLNTLNAIAVTTTTINYGSVSANANTGATNQMATTTNAGNSTTTLQLYAIQTLMNGSISMATNSQWFATSTFTCCSSATATAIGDGVANIANLGPGVITSTANGFIITAPLTTATSGALTTFWGLAVPNGQASGSYTGTNVFQSLFKP